MKSVVRDSVAYIVGRLISGKSTNSLYSYDVSKHLQYSGSVEGNINVYDNQISNFVTSSINNNSFNLYNHSVGNFTQITIDGSSFKGYDYDSGQFFNGKVNGNSISLYDYQDGNYHNYTI